MKILVACEFSGVVRDAFIARGHDAWSCDLEPSERPGPHLQEDVLGVIGRGWDMMIAFPPCTYLARSGARWHWGSDRQARALEFVARLMAAPIERIAIENPVGAINSQVRRPDMILQPWEYGHGETKATCLWLKNLPVLMVSDLVTARRHTVHTMPPGPGRARNRSRTYQGVADAMAEQWG